MLDQPPLARWRGETRQVSELILRGLVRIDELDCLRVVTTWGLTLSLGTEGGLLDEREDEQWDETELEKVTKEGCDWVMKDGCDDGMIEGGIKGMINC